MKKLLMAISFAGLLLTIVPSFLVFNGAISFESNKSWMLAGTICWFLTAPYWMNDKKS